MANVKLGEKQEVFTSNMHFSPQSTENKGLDPTSRQLLFSKIAGVMTVKMV